MLEPYVGFKVLIRRNEVQVQDERTQRDHMLEACHLCGVHVYVNMHQRRAPVVECEGAIHKTSSSKHNQEGRSILLRSRLSSSISSGMRKVKVWS
jgi:hypothetical protein